MQQDIHLTDHEYDLAVGLFYIFCGLFSVPSNLILKKIRPSIWFTTITLCFGLVTIIQGLVRNATGLLICRSFLGLTEGGLFPGVAIYLTSWYPRYETGLRTAIFFSAAPLAGAIGGFLARGINHMDQLGGLHGWSWIFIIEGLLAVLVGCFGYLLISDSPSRYMHSSSSILTH